MTAAAVDFPVAPPQPASGNPAGGSRLPARIAGWAAFLLVAGLLILVSGAEAWHLVLKDPDNFMRLTEVRDWLGGQSWWDLVQHRADPAGGGLYMHWSRLADLPFTATFLLFRLFTDPDTAERLALVVQPLLLLGIALWLQARIAVALGGPDAALPAIVVGALSGSMLVQFMPGRIDHHGLQIVLVLAATAALVRVRDWRGGVLAALACSVSLNVGLETAPYLVVLAAFVALRWAAIGAAVRSTTIGFTLGLAVAVPLLFVLTVPTAYWPMPKGDAIGRGHILLAVVGGIGLALLAWRARQRTARWAGLAALAIVLLALLHFAAAEIVAEPYRTVGPLLWRLWISNIAETRSLAATWAVAPLEAIGRMFFMVACALLALVELFRSRAALARGVIPASAVLAAMLTVAAVLLAAWELRSLALATAVCVPVAGGWLGRLWSSRTPRSRLVFALAAVLLSHIPDNMLTTMGTPAQAGPLPPPLACSNPQAMAILAAQPRGLVLAPIDQGGAILALTHHSVVATPIHRNVHGNRLAYEVLLATPDAARTMLAGSGVTYIAWCPGSPENRTLAREAPQGVLARLMRGERVGWLAPIDSPPAGLRLYRVAS